MVGDGLGTSNEIYKYELLWGSWKIDEFIGSGSIGEVYKISKDVYGKKHIAAVKLITVPTKDQYNTFLSFNAKMSEKEKEDYFYDIVKKMGNEINLLYELKNVSNIVTYEDCLIKKVEGRIFR